MKTRTSKATLMVLLLGLFIAVIAGCEKEDNPPVEEPEPIDTVTDIDGNVYPTVEIGEQIWMAENLRVTHYNDGEPIPSALSNIEWAATTSGAMAVYPYSMLGLSSDEEVLQAYGALYNGKAVAAAGICPVGWRVPTHNDWQVLASYVGGDQFAGTLLKSVRATPDAHPRWHNPESNIEITDDFGFSALPGGRRNVHGEFSAGGEFGYWWKSEGPGDNASWSLIIFPDKDYLLHLSSSENIQGNSIRCIKE